MNTHVCLVSSQPTPNLTPVLDAASRPGRVVLVVSPDMREQAAWLEAVIERHAIKVMQWPVDDAFDIEHVKDRMLELVDVLSDELAQKQLTLNVTGGTKPMSIAAYEVFRLYELPIFYVHPEKDRIVWMYPEGRQNRDLDDRIKLEDFLAAHGVEVRGEPGRNVPNSAWLEAGYEIISKIGQLQSALGVLNWLASKAEGDLTAHLNGREKASFHRLIELFEAHGALRIEGRRLRFPDEESRFFVNGGWLEYYVFDCVRKVRKLDPTIHDIARSIDVRRKSIGKPVPNEIDVAYLRNNRLHLIECKTARLSGKGEDSPGAEVLYKLDSLGDVLGGLKAQAMLVSFRALRDHDLRRAKSLGVTVCAGEDLKHLQQRLLQQG